jgi:hypothetical protein
MAQPRDDGTDPALSWASLLAHWTRLARASLALPESAEGDRWRRAVPVVIGLQAITCALREGERLPLQERRVACARAAVQIERYRRQLASLWQDDAMHPELAALVDDARAALAGLEAATRGSSAPDGR